MRRVLAVVIGLVAFACAGSLGLQGNPQRVASYDDPIVLTWDGGSSINLDGGTAQASDPIPFAFESGGYMACPVTSIPPANAGVTMTLQGTPHLYTAPGQTTTWASYSSTATCTALDGGSGICALDFTGIHAQYIRFSVANTGDGGVMGSATTPCEVNPKGNE